MRRFRLLADGHVSAELTPGEVMLLADLGMQFRSLLEAVGERARDDSADGFHDDEASTFLASGGTIPPRAASAVEPGEAPASSGSGSDSLAGFDDTSPSHVGSDSASGSGSRSGFRSDSASGSGSRSDFRSDSASGSGSRSDFRSDSGFESNSAPDSSAGAADDDDDVIFADVSEGDLDPVWDDPAVRRLFPDAYPEDPEASLDFRRYTIESATDLKLENVEALIASLVNGRDPEAIAATLTGADDVVVRLTPVQVQAWIRSLTDLRLTLAARLGIEEDGDEPEPTDADATAIYDIYDWLGWVQDSLVTTLAEGLPA